ncbi:MAG: bifunctional diaminohydroxyphosphoribosylaminopyrimidine deaminase/5-amino-6-(5-phosphoribosylamino)uracil reductase RibD [Thiomicrospira sp.]|nr:bifunctional diaminohydroxyphosphoribosylaminopyrimidine deaminase/5-amino-6-(5-phosphoribosylamino)uracil reductase RibD [Thiomicrospira sp.]
MTRAIELAKQGLFSTRPNPAVGCVIVKHGKLIAEGWHVKAGQPHAEVVALQAAGDQAKGATVYVTLEPCSHFGKTPPCADALIAAGVKQVVVAMQDPNPLVAGQGLARLQAAGIKVEVGIQAAQAAQLNQGFIKRMQAKRPFVRLKLASSVDGRTAMASGESVWITGEAARESVHKLRARHGAIITGIGTVLADDPSLNVRLAPETQAKLGLDDVLCHPIRVVLDPNLSMPLEAKMLSLPGRTLVMTSQATAQNNKSVVETLLAQGAEIVAVQAQDDRLDLDSVLDYLAQEEQVSDVMVESGAIVAGAFIEAGLVDELHWFVAPHLMGHQGKPLLMLPGLVTMQDRISLKAKSVEAVGDDWHFVFGFAAQ